jgi:small subunit ribosomal protein S7
MPRRREVPKRKILPDPKFHDVVVAKFINNLMGRGKRSLAEKIFYEAMAFIEQRTKQDPLEIFRAALDNAKPGVEVKSRRVGGSTYQVPIEVPYTRQQALGIRWLISFARSRSERSMAESLGAELMDASQNRGATIKKKDDTHRMAEANKAFAHYRW